MRTAPRSEGGTRLLYPLLVALLTLFAIAPLTYPGSLQTHNGLTSVYNLMNLDARLGTAGWAPDFGRGFDLLRMDGPLPYAVAEFFHLLGFGFAASINLVVAIAILLSGIGMYFCAGRLFRSAGVGLVAALVYVYFPYHLALVYVRGALGETVLWAVFPFAVLALAPRAAAAAIRWTDYVPASILFTLLVLAQPGLGLLLALAVPLAYHSLANARVRRVPVERAVGMGVLAALLLLAPAALQNGNAYSAFRFTPAFADAFQLLTASWGTSLPKGSYLEQFPYQVGLAALGLSIAALALSLRGHKQLLTRAAVLLSALILLLMTPPAAPLWQVSGATTIVEYPFQLLGVVGFALALAAGSVVAAEPRLQGLEYLAALAILPIITVYPHLAPEHVDFVPSRPPVAVFNDNELALLDYQILRPPGIFRHGATVQLLLHWQALRQVNHDYTVFLHAVDETGKTWGGEDSKPQDGQLPTLQWSVGRVITDTHSVQINLAGPPEGYHLELGLYATATGERAVTATGASELRIDEIRQ